MFIAALYFRGGVLLECEGGVWLESDDIDNLLMILLVQIKVAMRMRRDASMARYGSARMLPTTVLALWSSVAEACMNIAIKQIRVIKNCFIGREMIISKIDLNENTVFHLISIININITTQYNNSQASTTFSDFEREKID